MCVFQSIPVSVPGLEPEVVVVVVVVLQLQSVCCLFTDGRHQSVSDGDTLLFHWSELSAEIPAPAEGRDVFYVHAHVRTAVLNVPLTLVSPSQYMVFFEFNDRMEAVMKKAYIYR